MEDNFFVHIVQKKEKSEEEPQPQERKIQDFQTHIEVDIHANDLVLVPLLFEQSQVVGADLAVAKRLAVVLHRVEVQLVGTRKPKQKPEAHPFFPQIERGPDGPDLLQVQTRGFEQLADPEDVGPFRRKLADLRVAQFGFGGFVFAALVAVGDEDHVEGFSVDDPGGVLFVGVLAGTPGVHAAALLLDLVRPVNQLARRGLVHGRREYVGDILALLVLAALEILVNAIVGGLVQGHVLGHGHEDAVRRGQRVEVLQKHLGDQRPIDIG